MSERLTHLFAIRRAWREYKSAVEFEAFCLKEDGDDIWGHPGLPAPLAWLCAPWRPLVWRFHPDNLERLFRPQKAQRRQRLADMSEYVFVLGADDTTDEWWAEAAALVAEFGGNFPPRDWEPMSPAETVGAIMGYTREEVAEIIVGAS